MQIRKAASEFAGGEIAEHALEWDAAERVPTPAMEQATELGFVGMTLPERHGGIGLGLLEECLVTEEFATASPGAARAILEPGWGGELLSLVEHLPSVLKEKVGRGPAFGLALPSEGVFSLTDGCSDFSATFSLVHRDAELFLIPGLFHGEEGLFYLTSDGSCQGAFPLGNQLGLRSWPAARLELRGFHLSERYFLRCPGAVKRSRQARAIRTGALSLGLARGAALLALAYARGRRLFNQTLLDFEATRAKFFKIWQRLQAARLLLYKAAGDWDKGLNVSLGACSVEALAVALAEETADEALQLLGGYGYFEEMKIAMFYRDAKMLDLLREPISSSIEAVWPSLAIKASW
ncbi:MAG: acyl-CoA dehydrogenase family protein [Thermodesulfobacteriota bacterium]